MESLLFLLKYYFTILCCLQLTLPGPQCAHEFGQKNTIRGTSTVLQMAHQFHLPHLGWCVLLSAQCSPCPAHLTPRLLLMATGQNQCLIQAQVF